MIVIYCFEVTMNKIHVFDFDGTLANSMPYFCEGMLNVVRQLGVSYPDDVINIITPLGYKKTAEYFVNELGAKESLENIYRMMAESLVYQYTYNVKIKPGVREYLQKLRDAGCRLFVLSASPHLVLDVCMDRNGITEFFEQVWSTDDYGLTKAGTELFFKLAGRIGCEPQEITFYDDNAIAVKNCQAVGLETVAVYDASNDAFQDEIKANCDKYARSFLDLL